MKNNVRYLGSVRFYKHLILTVTALVILIPTILLCFTFIHYRKVKQNYQLAFDEQVLYINQLEEALADLTEQKENTNTDIEPESKESQHVQETPGRKTITDNSTPLIPFSVDLTELKYILVNDGHPLPQSFQPELVETRNEKLVHKEIQPFLEQMLDAAEREGISIIICSAYRDYEKQAELVQSSIEKLMQKGYSYTEAHWQTRRDTAMVGNSEHHTGLAIDLVGFSHQTLDKEHADTPEAIWLREHAHEYGFILRYPQDKEDITGFIYESWHYRYVGKSAAAFIKEHQLCLEEFLDLVTSQEK